MTPPRPVPIVFALLAVAGISKLTLSAVDYRQPVFAPSAGEVAPSLFMAAAAATEEDAPGSAVTSGCMPSEDGSPSELLAAIIDERGLLDEQRLVLAQRAAEIDLANEALAIETTRLDELKQEVESMLERATMAHVADVDRLVALYTNMKPRDAASIMNDLDLEVTVTVLGTMAERNAAPILAAINPVRARALSLILLERAKLPGDRRLDRIRLD